MTCFKCRRDINERVEHLTSREGRPICMRCDRDMDRGVTDLNADRRDEIRKLIQENSK